jgi:hypothetical protein
MKNYGIMRIEKIKLSDGGGLRRRATHNYRQNDNTRKVFEPRLTRTNEYLITSSYDEMIEKARQNWAKLDKKPRSDAVGMLEVMITTTAGALSPMSEKEFFADCLKELSSWYGAENVVGLTIHRDETTPHCHAFITPVSQKLIKPTRHKEGEKPVATMRTTLDAKKVISDRKSLIILQDNVFKRVFMRYGLSRGDHLPGKKRNVRSDLRKRSERLDKREKALDKYEAEINQYEKDMVKRFKRTLERFDNGECPDIRKKKPFESATAYYNKVVYPRLYAYNNRIEQLQSEVYKAEDKGYQKAKGEERYLMREQEQQQKKQQIFSEIKQRKRIVRSPKDDVDWER